MLLKYFYDPALAHASYLVGCQKTKSAVVVDPGRDVQQYLDAAKREGVRITAVAETHIHADYVSGARELADRIDAKLYVSDEGPQEWKYQFLESYQHELLHDGDEFKIGNIRFEVMHTPGHTPESISFVVTDEGGGANKPMGIFTGDFVFVGSIGRPDLLEKAAGIMDTAERGARDLFQSVIRFKELPEYLQVWPAHGAGSACGKGLGAIPSSTVGYEKRFNPALQFDNEQEFVKYILADQPDAPKYFAVMKRVNKVGPILLGEKGSSDILPITELQAALADGTVVDLSASAVFSQGHVSKSINIPLNMLAAWAGWILDYSKPVYLIGESEQIEEAVRVLHKIGIDHVAGYFDAFEVRNSGLAVESYTSLTPDELSSGLEQDRFQLIDVRSDAEWEAGHIAGAEHLFLGTLPDHLDQVGPGRPVVTQCRSGARSSIAASLLQAAGHTPINLEGGYTAWTAANLPTAKEHDSNAALRS